MPIQQSHTKANLFLEIAVASSAMPCESKSVPSDRGRLQRHALRRCTCSDPAATFCLQPRGRAALQRRVKPATNAGFSPCGSKKFKLHSSLQSATAAHIQKLSE